MSFNIIFTHGNTSKLNILLVLNFQRLSPIKRDIKTFNDYNYSLDRMLTNLKLSGKLDSVKGIVVGQFTKMTQGSDKSVEEIIKEKVGDLGIPVMYGVDAGHGSPNLPLYLGRSVSLNINSSTATLSFK